MDVYVLWYARQTTTGVWTGTNIGYYPSLAKLEEARERLRQRPGFRDYPDGFYVNCYRMDVEYDDPMFFTCWGPGRQPAPVLGETIGLDTPERPFEVLLWRNTELPISYASLLPTGADNQLVAQVKLVAETPHRRGRPVGLVSWWYRTSSRDRALRFGCLSGLPWMSGVRSRFPPAIPNRGKSSRLRQAWSPSRLEGPNPVLQLAAASN
jgi:hypothetical protein